MNEIWKQIDNYPNYSISSLGNIKNSITNKLLKPNNKGGYYIVSLTCNKIKKCHRIHRLVAMSFIDNPENKSDVNHKDKNCLNNNANNLEWMTRKENNIHRCKNAIITTNKNKIVNRIDIKSNVILETYNSIEDAALWLVSNNLTKNTHNGRNSIGNCISGLSKTAYNFKWKLFSNVVMHGEIWKKANVNHMLFKEYYVSNLGRFKNSNGIIMENYKINKNGYIRVNICNKTYLLHRLVALTFIDNLEDKPQINHIDGNKLNNNINNLEWVTNKENQIHKCICGLGNNHMRKIGQFNLDNILIKEYASIVEASINLHISKSNISGVLRNYRKTAGGFIWKYLD